MTSAKPTAQQLAEDAKGATKTVAKETKAATRNPWFDRAARLGYVIRAGLYGTVGALALRAALGDQVTTEDLRGTLILLPGGIVRTVLLVILIVGLFGYGLWGFVRAIFDPLRRGSDPAGVAARIGFAWSGMNYFLLVIFAMAFLVGASSSDGSDNLFKAVNKTLAYPGGWFVLVVAGAIGTLSGLGQLADAVTAGFRKDMRRGEMTEKQRTVVDNLGRFGMVSRGIVFGMLGWFILQAGLAHDAHRSHNMRQVFSTIGSLPLGRAVLAGVAIGLIALAMHSLACARWMRIQG